MKKHEMEQALRRAAEELPQADYNAAAHTEVQRMEVHDYITRQAPALSRRRWVPIAAAVCLLLFLGGGGWYYWAFRMVYSTLYLDTKPSFAITLNRENRVLDVEGRNDDAEALLEGRTYRDWTLNALLGALADDMERGGYLTAETDDDAVRVSVESRNDDRAKVLTIETEDFFDHRFDDPDDPEPTPSPTPTPELHGEEKSDGYEHITPKEAGDIILAMEPNAGIYETKLDDNDDGTWVYEIECYVGEDKYDAQVDAVTGEVLTWELDD